MTKITRTHLIKAIVAEEMRLLDQSTVNTESYAKTLGEAYKQWEHKASDELCLRYNKINNNTVTVSMLSHDA
tara:strand:+ start:1690 stop:1905 length:216 start_codon:yes stop_codon:yes gene_type:complete